MAGRFITIGRASGADIRLSDTSISRRHAKAHLEEGGAAVTVIDDGSMNGCWRVDKGRRVRFTHETFGPAERLFFGHVEVSAGQLIAALRRQERSEAARAMPRIGVAIMRRQVRSDAAASPRRRSDDTPVMPGRG